MGSTTISGYTTTYNCIEKGYPFEECLHSLLGFCDEVAVADAGSTDGTIERVEAIAAREARVKLAVHPVDFSHPRWAIHMDGYLKAKARRLCTADYCWQIDTDEIVPPHDWARVRMMPKAARDIFEVIPVLYLPMVEYWGSFRRIRSDFVCVKPRMSVNDLRITHGIPLKYRSVDADGHEYPTPFETDSCNYMYEDTGEAVPVIFPLDMPDYNMPMHEYEPWFNHALELLPCVLHVSWLNLRRKIRHYREFWPRFHASMYDLERADTAESNVMFDKPWAEVTDADIEAMAEELELLGPRSFHARAEVPRRGPTIENRWPVPDFLLRWAERTGAA